MELAKAYQEETGVEVEVWPIAGDDYYQNLKTYMASESGPTVFTLNSASEIAEMSGYLADLSDLEVMGKVQENLIAMVDGKKTGVPMTARGLRHYLQQEPGGPRSHLHHGRPDCLH